MIRSYIDYKRYLELDSIANGFNYKLSLRQIIKDTFAPNYIMRFLRILRKTEYLNNCSDISFRLLRLYFCRILLRRIQLKLGFSIPINVFGPGLSIPHYGTIVINPKVRVGCNCRLHVGVNIGASGGHDKVPIIGDNVYIGPGSIIFGDITIGDNVMVAANATVNKTFREDNVVLAGTPAKIVKHI